MGLGFFLVIQAYFTRTLLKGWLNFAASLAERMQLQVRGEELKVNFLFLLKLIMC